MPLAAVIVFLPLLAAIVTGLFGRSLGDRLSQAITCGGVLGSAALSLFVFQDVIGQHHTQSIVLLRWIDTGPLSVSWGLRLDSLSAVMMFVVSVVSFLIHVYSVGYMAHDKGVPRFMSYLSLFTFAMLALVTADNFVQLFFGWEGVGLVSYLLIGFWFDRPSANAAAIKAFVVNRIGDFGFMLGIFAVFVLFGTLDFTPVFAAAPGMAGKTIDFLGWHPDALTLAGLLLLMGAMGKSAQLGLHTWLPDAMEGPTPVSALIHAATMVTAGVFMLCRLSPMLEYAPVVLNVVVVVGATTAIFAATIGLAQTDIKRVIAYSTCSQLGYMFFAAGVSAYPAAMFHLTTHAFFKALLFLTAGSVIHALAGEQDMRKMGGLWKAIPMTYALMWIGNLALAGIWPFSGYYSKDIIVDAAYAAGTSVGSYAFVLGVAAAFLTSFYSWRLLFMTFHGKPRMDASTFAHVHESPPVMIVPLCVLALGASVAGYLGYDSFVGAGQAEFWGSSILILPQHGALAGAEHLSWTVTHATLISGLLGIAAAWVFYVAAPGLPTQVATGFRPVYLLFLNKWYFDEIYAALLTAPVHVLGRWFWKGGDHLVIDGLSTDIPVAASKAFSLRLSHIETGYIFHYAFAMLLGVLGFVSWYLYAAWH
jgi:NADH-quinone oxidoreductase subunit L